MFGGLVMIEYVKFPFTDAPNEAMESETTPSLSLWKSTRLSCRLNTFLEDKHEISCLKLQIENEFFLIFGSLLSYPFTLIFIEIRATTPPNNKPAQKYTRPNNIRRPGQGLRYPNNMPGYVIWGRGCLIPGIIFQNLQLKNSKFEKKSL